MDTTRGRPLAAALVALAFAAGPTGCDSGLAIEADGRAATALYETCTDHVAVDPEDLLELLAGERLAWQTDPAVNRAGRGIDVEALGG